MVWEEIRSAQIRSALLEKEGHRWACAAGQHWCGSRALQLGLMGVGCLPCAAFVCPSAAGQLAFDAALPAVRVAVLEGLQLLVDNQHAQPVLKVRARTEREK
jgi:hypothetical protein